MWINGKERRSQYERIQDAVRRNDEALENATKDPAYIAWVEAWKRREWIEEQKKKHPTLYE